MLNEYDVIIIGGGPAGLAAAVYSARYGIKSLVISKTQGGLAATAHIICNFPTYLEIKGYELMQKFIKQVENLKVPIIYDIVTKIEKTKTGFLVITNKKKYTCKKVILGIGTERIKLNIPGEKKLYGRGVSYCTTCDGPFYKNKTVAVVGGGNAALTSALQLADIGKEVYLIHRRDEFRGDNAWIKAVENDKRIKKLMNEEVIEIIGEKKIESVKLKSGKTLNIEGIFIEIGSKPDIDFLSNLKIDLDEKNYIVTDKYQKTNIHGLFAAGDITGGPLKQINTAVSQGSVAAFSTYSELKKEFS